MEVGSVFIVVDDDVQAGGHGGGVGLRGWVAMVTVVVMLVVVVVRVVVVVVVLICVGVGRRWWPLSSSSLCVCYGASG